MSMEGGEAYCLAMAKDSPRKVNGAGRKVGLGRVVEDRLSIGSPDLDDPGGGDENDVRTASEDSFPASDPPTWVSHPATSKARSSGARRRRPPPPTSEG
jgi:hypothetical protein